MTRLLPPSEDALSDEQRRVFEMIASGPRGKVRGPLAIWLHRPELAQAAQALGAYCRYGSLLESRLSELVILTMATLWKSEFEWWAHKPIALKAGLSPDIVDALQHGAQPEFGDAEERIVHGVVVELTEQRQLSDTTYKEAQEILGADRLVDLIGVCGYYTLISMTINAFEVPLPDGEAAELTSTRK